MRIQDETMRELLELALMKLRDEDISGGIVMLEDILFKLLKRL